jgi:hypothetical protein
MFTNPLPDFPVYKAFGSGRSVTTLGLSGNGEVPSNATGNNVEGPEVSSLTAEPYPVTAG